MFDNTDVNVRVLHKSNTVHAMEGIQCVAPSTSINAQVKCQRIQNVCLVPFF